MHHFRNYSSPAFMANQLVPGQTQAQPHLHQRQASSSESFGYMTAASSSSSINQPQQQQHCHQAGTIVQQQQQSHQFNNSHCSSNGDQYQHNNNSHHNHNQHTHHHLRTYMQPQAQLVQQPVQRTHLQPQVPQQQMVQHYRNYSSPAFMPNQLSQNSNLGPAVQQPQIQAQLPHADQANLHLRQASSSESFEYVTQANGTGHHQESQLQIHYNVNQHAQHAQHHQPHCQQVSEIVAQQQQPIQFNNQHCSSNLDQNQNYHQNAQPEPAQLAGSTMLARSFMRQPPYGVSSLGQ